MNIKLTDKINKYNNKVLLSEYNIKAYEDIRKDILTDFLNQFLIKEQYEKLDNNYEKLLYKNKKIYSKNKHKIRIILKI